MNKVTVIKSIHMPDERTVEVVYDDNVKITLKDTVEVFGQISEITKNKRVARLSVNGRNHEITNAARLAMAEENRNNRDLIIGEAIVVHSFYQRVRTNLYMRLIKRKYPIQCFTDMNSAREWLAWLVKTDKKIKKTSD